MRLARTIQRSKWAAVAALLLAAATASTEQEVDEYAEARSAMVAEIGRYARSAGDTAEHAFDSRVMQALAEVPRHEFVPDDQKRVAYENRPLPIGHGQTISQPYIVALMTDLSEAEPDSTVLEIGTGSGYQAAIFSALVENVYSIEIVEPLANDAKARLERLGFDNVTTRLGDGYDGWEEHAPFDAIVVTAAASHVPPPLIAQLKPGGRMVIPVGGRFLTQQLLLIEKTADDEIVTRQIAAVRFVPLTGEH
ncbi:MAG: protein-L-isoaspartate(D-aspartate) O-methyltransferase [Woeseia sp.]